MTRLARTHNKTRALKCHPPPLRGKSSTVHRPRRPRVSQHLPAVNPHPITIHSRPFEQPFRTGSETRYHPDPPQISRTDTRVSPDRWPSAWDKTGGAGVASAAGNRGICSSTALSPARLTAINAVIGAIFSTCATASDDIQPALATLSL